MLNFKPTTPSRRFMILVAKKTEIARKKNFLKKLRLFMHSTAGRNNTGRITVFHRGGGNKRLYNIIDFKRHIFDVHATVMQICYDSYRSAYLAFIKYDNGVCSFIVAPKFLTVGSRIFTGNSGEFIVGNSFPLKNIPVGMHIHNIELFPGKGAKLARAAGMFGRIIKKLEDKGSVLIKLNSKSRNNFIEISGNSFATIGIVSNDEHQNISLGKAGYSRWLGCRPVVRGVAMNPIDHPHGGGEGKTSGSKVSKTPWGWPTKGFRTVRKFKKNV